MEKIYQDIKSILKKDEYSVSDYKIIDYGIQFTIFLANWSGILRIYKNKKGIIKIDYSQLKNDYHIVKIKSLIESTNKELDGRNFIKSKYDFGYPIIGTDESGKGDYFGPLVSAGVYVDERISIILTSKGVQDSKKLSDNRNLELAQEIMKLCNGSFSIIEISPERYNDLYAQFVKEKKNLNTLLAWGHAKAIEEILGKNDCNIAISDKFSDESYILNKMQEKGKKIKLIQIHKAENNIAVAAASIIARARFLEKLKKLSSEYEVNFPKGASQHVVENGKIFVLKYGINALKKVAKVHFKTTESII